MQGLNSTLFNTMFSFMRCQVVHSGDATLGLVLSLPSTQRDIWVGWPQDVASWRNFIPTFADLIVLIC
jgi:hypothetical protein